MQLSVRNRLSITPDRESEPFSSAGTGRVADGDLQAFAPDG
jgi:hypothetical protein